VNIYEILRRPVVTEKGTGQIANGKYTFEVAVTANKAQIQEAVEKVFKVKVLDVNVIRVPGKMRRVGRHHGMTTPWKKAIVTVAPGQRIEIFEGV
jgi:large subunit ribosomal protein L23